MTIPAIRIEVNGELVAVAGAKDASLLTASLGLGAGAEKDLAFERPVFSVMALVGVAGDAPRQLSWCDHVHLRKGDRVTFELVEVDEATPPSKALSTPSSTELQAEAEKKGRRK
ncbi:hypothetical protein GCM10028796_46620 [Ramlibacter monticola]|uniref:Uncharacterized protein n=1 Tax=Ramlibacter monticola TaxID=1926872 RepID=A0A936Z4N8_9BURK|nr:hypothetical protein [Ramlibacter monticola]MBL0394287.1 hypothetical protein [Ramlibacter monticola]